MSSSIGITLAERGLLPDVIIRAGVRRLLASTLADVGAGDVEAAAERENSFVDSMTGEIAPLTALANEQHYTVPVEFFAQVLGSRVKYSCCYYPTPESTLDEAEDTALRMTCERARVVDGMDILELGCGWGCLTLWMAEHYPGARIIAVSNSPTQRVFIEDQARWRGLSNVTVLTADMNTFDPGRRFDRVISIEMFEHMRNYAALFGRISSWLNPGGLFFMHIFCHRNAAYAFATERPEDWMGRMFFNGGIMPSDELPLRFQRDLRLIQRWRWDGRHYERTANDWLARMQTNRATIMPVLARTYGAGSAKIWWARWRMFFMACAETFGFNAGQEWYVGHYLFEPA